jgi:hypothetical protein
MGPMSSLDFKEKMKNLLAWIEIQSLGLQVHNLVAISNTCKESLDVQNRVSLVSQ